MPDYFTLAFMVMAESGVGPGTPKPALAVVAHAQTDRTSRANKTSLRIANPSPVHDFCEPFGRSLAERQLEPLFGHHGGV